MASPNENLLHNVDVNNLDFAKNVKRKKPKEDETEGSIIKQRRKYRKSTNRDQPDELCNCPHNCGEKIPVGIRKKLFEEYGQMSEEKQNDFLEKYIEMRSVNKRLWSGEERVGGRLQRRVSCKYRVPLLLNGDHGPKKTKDKDKDELKKMETKDKKEATDEGGKEKGPTDVTEVCLKAFMNMYALTEKKIRLVREKLILDSRKDAGLPVDDEGKVIEGLDEDISQDQVASLLLNSINRDMKLVDAFFCNQLWQPEYIGVEETVTGELRVKKIRKPMKKAQEIRKNTTEEQSPKNDEVKQERKIEEAKQGIKIDEVKQDTKIDEAKHETRMDEAKEETKIDKQETNIHTVKQEKKVYTINLP